MAIIQRLKLCFRTVITLLAIAGLVSCASYKLHIDKEFEDWDQQMEAQLPERPPDYTLYLIGDAGKYVNHSRSPALEAAEWLIDRTETEMGLVFLGDNIYPDGMPGKEDPERSRAEKYLLAQIELAKKAGKHSFFIPGNHDWYGDGPVKSLERQADFIEESLDREAFLPEPGCPGPEVVELTENTGLILIDSQWYLEDWDKYSDFNENCEIYTREEFLFELGEAIKDYKYKRLILALHHPLYSNGPHGGNFPAIGHIFPFLFVQDKAYIPMPVIGTVINFIRKTTGISQDLAEARYRQLRVKLDQMTEYLEGMVFASGHEHALQYFEVDERHHIVAGSGAKINPVKKDRDMKFGLGDYGLSRLLIYDTGEIFVEFYKGADPGEPPQRLFARQLTGPLPKPDLDTFQFKKYTPDDSVRAAVYNDFKDRSGLYRLIFGTHYSPLYNDSIKVPVFLLDHEKGGLTPVKRGGGNQTNSLRLRDGKGHEYVLRAVKKDATKLLPKAFAGTIATEMVRYQYTSAHPYAAVPIPVLSHATGVLHTNPRIVFVPRQPALGEFNADHGDKLYLFEERPDEDWSEAPFFGNSKEIISTGSVLEELREDWEHRIDQKAVARARMFDLLVGDWDRHDDQWRWAEYKEPGGKKRFVPIPRDRDQPFARFDGLVLALARLTGPEVAKFQTYDKDPKQLAYMNYNSRFFDRTFLNELEWEDWAGEIRHIQSSLTDETIDSALALWPRHIYDYRGDHIAEVLKYRRDHLMEIGKRFYLILAREVSITGTDDADYFLVERLEGGETRVRVYDLSSEDKPDELYYQRKFNPEETREIHLYGLDGKDHLVVEGEARKGIKVRLIGGTDTDIYVDSSRVRGWSHKTVLYDRPDKAKVDAGREARVVLTDDYYKNSYDRKGFRFSFFSPLPMIMYNPDHDLLLGPILNYTHAGFKKEPYGSRHTLSGVVSTATGGWRVRYEGHYPMVFREWGLRTRLLYQDPFYVTNFFGFGNETPEPPDEESFNRVRLQKESAEILLSIPLGRFGFFEFGPVFEQNEIERTDDRFVDEAFPPDHPVFDSRAYLGGKAELDLFNLDDPLNPGTGLRIRLGYNSLFDLENGKYNLNVIKSGLTFYVTIDNQNRWVVASNTGFKLNLEDNFLLYQSQFLGGAQNLRGFRNERFAGKKAFFQNVDLRWRALGLQSYFIPTDFGLYVGGDIGRVWLENDDSDDWHLSAGGGIWFNPFGAAVIRAGYFASKEEGRILFGIGFDF